MPTAPNIANLITKERDARLLIMRTMLAMKERMYNQAHPENPIPRPQDELNER